MQGADHAAPLKVFHSHIGFYDTILAAPSMKAAIAAWGANAHIFQHGFAEQTSDPDAVSAALAQPGIVLRRPFGTKGPYKTQPEAIRGPKTSPRQRQDAAKAERARKQMAAADERAQAKAVRQAKKNVKSELADIEKEEARLRARRQALQKKFRLQGV